MSVIYHTPYMRWEDEWLPLAVSEITGHQTFDAIVAERGEPLKRERKFLIYGDEVNRELYSKDVWFTP